METIIKLTLCLFPFIGAAVLVLLLFEIGKSWRGEDRRNKRFGAHR